MPDTLTRILELLKELQLEEPKQLLLRPVGITTDLTATRLQPYMNSACQNLIVSYCLVGVYLSPTATWSEIVELMDAQPVKATSSNLYLSWTLRNQTFADAYKVARQHLNVTSFDHPNKFKLNVFLELPDFFNCILPDHLEAINAYSVAFLKQELEIPYV